jgi:hypothetical protein
VLADANPLLFFAGAGASEPTLRLLLFAAASLSRALLKKQLAFNHIKVGETEAGDKKLLLWFWFVSFRTRV